MPFGNMFGGQGSKQNPLGLGGLAKLESDPKVAKWLKDDIIFRNQFDMLKQNPNMILQLMGSDPRWMEIFKMLTGVDLGAMAEMQQQKEAEKTKRDEEMAKIAE